MDMTLADNWWAIAVRGVAGVVFGAIALFWPPAAVVALVLLFGAYALVDGVFNLIAAFRAPRSGRPWGWLAFSGIVGVIAGVVTFFRPGLTALALVLVIGWWAIITGIAQIIAAIRLRKHIQHEWLLGVSGLLSIALGVLLLARPGIGAITVAIWVGVYALLFGILLIALGFRLRKWGRSQRPGDRDLRGTPVPRPA